MAPRVRRSADDSTPWWQQLATAWPLILATLTIIAFIVNVQRDIAEMKGRSILNTSRIQSIDARTDSLAKSAEIRDYMICKVFETLVHEKQGSINVPKRCDDVFQGWGIR